MTETFDIIVIGSGGGMKIALPAAQRKLRTALIEEGPVAGTCLNRGCIPSKMLIYPTELPRLVAEARRVDVHCDGPVRVDWPSLVRRTRATVDALSERQRRRLLETPHLELVTGHAEFVANHTVRVGSRHLTAPRIFIATGSRPVLPDLPGLRDVPFMTSTEALRCEQLPRRLLVIGAGYIAVELGAAYAGAGAEVAFVVRSRLLRREDDEIAACFAERFGRHHEVHQGAQPTDVRLVNGLIDLGLGDGRRLTGDALLVATGTAPCTDDLGLEHTDIRRDDAGTIVVDDHLRTSVEGVYALGDCIGRYFFRHTVNHEGEYLVRSVLDGRAGPIDYGPVPHAVFTDPEVAGVGLTEQQARRRNLDVLVGRAAYADSNVALARGIQDGLVKVLIRADDARLVGAHAVGPEASNLIHLFVVAMKMNATLDDLLSTIFIHPALPEVARDALRDAARRRSA